MKLLHSDTFLGTIYNFYIAPSGFLKAATIPLHGTNEDHAFTIRGLPPGALMGLDDQWKRQEVKRILEECRFNRVGFTVFVELRGRGGWGEDIHKGYKTDDSDEPIKKKARDLCWGWGEIPWKIKEPTRRLVNPEDGGAQGTWTWAKDVGIGTAKKGLVASNIAYYCNHVDFAKETNPAYGKMSKALYPDKIRQSWHFNTAYYEDTESYMAMADSRFEHSIKCLIKAVVQRHHALLKKSDKNYKRSLELLGQGLHPLQDMFAHTKNFVSMGHWAKLYWWPYMHHLSGRKQKEADNACFIDAEYDSPETDIKWEPEARKLGSDKDGNKIKLSQRYSDTKTMSYIYLLLYRLTTDLAFARDYREHVDVIVRRLRLPERVKFGKKQVFLDFALAFRDMFSTKNYLVSEFLIYKVLAKPEWKEGLSRTHTTLMNVLNNVIFMIFPDWKRRVKNNMVYEVRAHIEAPLRCTTSDGRHRFVNSYRLYEDKDITVYLRAFIAANGGYAFRCNYLLGGTYPEHDEKYPYYVAVTPAVDTLQHASPIDFYLNKNRQQSPGFGRRDDRRDVFVELRHILIGDAGEFACNIKILFPYNITQVHWLTGEIKIQKRGNKYAIKILAHNPHGRGTGGKNGMDDKNYYTILKSIHQRISSLDREATFAEIRSSSPYTSQRQNPRDTTSCGVIVAREITDRILGRNLNMGNTYPVGAAELRLQQIMFLRAHHPYQSADGQRIIADQFAERNTIPNERVTGHKRKRNDESRMFEGNDSVMKKRKT